MLRFNQDAETGNGQILALTDFTTFDLRIHALHGLGGGVDLFLGNRSSAHSPPTQTCNTATLHGTNRDFLFPNKRPRSLPMLLGLPGFLLVRDLNPFAVPHFMLHEWGWGCAYIAG